MMIQKKKTGRTCIGEVVVERHSIVYMVACAAANAKRDYHTLNIIDVFVPEVRQGLIWIEDSYYVEEGSRDE